MVVSLSTTHGGRGRLGSDTLMVGFDDLKGLFQPKQLFYSNSSSHLVIHYLGRD